MRAALSAVRARDEHPVLVLGHPDHSPRFGFAPAPRYGIKPSFEAADESMTALVLDGPGEQAGPAGVPRGTISCPAAFGV
ncbi:hypothetical protein [Streptomyces sp. YIM 121038]|uniref:hypothetical protein n=1 Tax=Streptomyces sp. YIM 121038 TaxID=2136401 RepID=UPI0011107317|nr:hypothetical protein [Streptomyces sp. YIM 121038]